MVIPGKTPQLSIRDLQTGDVKVVARTEGAAFPFWAPDSQAVGFFAGAKLLTVNVESGAVQTICDAPSGRGGAWSPLGVIVFAPNISTPIMKVSENGGVPVAVTKPAPMTSHRNPTLLPDGKHFLFCEAPANAGTAGSLRVGSIEGGFDRQVLPYASITSFVNGWLLSVHDRNLIAQRFDPDAFAVEGKQAVIAQNVDWYPARYVGVFSAGAETLVYKHLPHPERQLLRMDSANAQPLPIGDAAFLTLAAISADGGRVIVNRSDPGTTGSDLWMLDAGGAASRLTFSARGTMEDSAVFSPDGQHVALSENGADGTYHLWIQPAGGGKKEALRPDLDTGSAYLGDWSRDGKTILFSPQRQKTGWDVEIIRLDEHKPVPLMEGPFNESRPRFSPDQKWIAYDSDESGRLEIYVTNYPAATGKWQVSTQGGSLPSWSADGRQLYYLAGDRVFVTDVHSGDSFTAGAPRAVNALGDHIKGFAVAANGRIVALREIDPGQPPLTIVRDWEQLLRGK